MILKSNNLFIIGILLYCSVPYKPDIIKKLIDNNIWLRWLLLILLTKDNYNNLIIIITLMIVAYIIDHNL